MTKKTTRGNACVSPRLYESQEVLSLLKLLSASTAFCDKPVSVLILRLFRWRLWLRLESYFILNNTAPLWFWKNITVKAVHILSELYSNIFRPCIFIQIFSPCRSLKKVLCKFVFSISCCNPFCDI